MSDPARPAEPGSHWAEALTEVLHTWSNQLETFGLANQLNGVWIELRDFLNALDY